VDDGLVKPWHGRVFVNPPYGKTETNKSMAAAFCQRAIDQYEDGTIEACVILVNSLHSQSWQKPLYDYPICLVDHRISFVSGEGKENENPTFQNMFVYLGPNKKKFAEVFSRFGYVMYPDPACSHQVDKLAAADLRVTAAAEPAAEPDLSAPCGGEPARGGGNGGGAAHI
jgi:DNA N-6-adenine-methyltransferase (Dam)